MAHNILGRPNNRRRFSLAAVAGLTLMITSQAVWGGGAVIAAPGAEPMLESQVPFVVPGSAPGSSRIETIHGALFDVPPDMSEGDFAVWTTCMGATVPALYPTSKIVYATPSQRTIRISVAIDVSDFDKSCTLNAVALRIGSGVVFWPEDHNPRLDSIELNGKVVDEP